MSATSFEEFELEEMEDEKEWENFYNTVKLEFVEFNFGKSICKAKEELVQLVCKQIEMVKD